MGFLKLFIAPFKEQTENPFFIKLKYIKHEMNYLKRERNALMHLFVEVDTLLK